MAGEEGLLLTALAGHIACINKGEPEQRIDGIGLEVLIGDVKPVEPVLSYNRLTTFCAYTAKVSTGAEIQYDSITLEVISSAQTLPMDFDGLAIEYLERMDEALVPVTDENRVTGICAVLGVKQFKPSQRVDGIYLEVMHVPVPYSPNINVAFLY